MPGRRSFHSRSISMKRVTCLVSAAVLILAAAAFAQPPGGGQGGQKIGLATSLQRGYNAFKTNFTQAAEKMPDADYGFKPGSTPEARTYTAVIAHIAQTQFAQCSGRSEERRVGKECRSRWSPYH